MVDITSLPYCEFLGVKQIAMGDQDAIALEPAPHHHNHLGTIHAGVIFSIGEATAAQALVDAFPDLVDSAVPVLRTASVKYRRPASNLIHGVASIEEESAARLRSQLARKGVGGIDVSVSVMETDTELLSGVYSWFVQQRQVEKGA